MSETVRRVVGLTIVAAFLATMVWVAASEIGKTPAADRGKHWLAFAIAATLAAAVMGWYSWRKLTRPSFDTRFSFGTGSPVLIPLLGGAYLLSRVASRDTGALIVAGGLACGFFAGILAVYGFDALTNRLSKGRSWRAFDAGETGGSHSSNTSSPS